MRSFFARKIIKTKVLLKALLLPLLLVLVAAIQRDNRLEDPDPSVRAELESFRVADGFEVTLFASEPLVVKPIQMNWDADGRLWVVSSTAYPMVKTGEVANDKIYVLEDTDGDGKADKSTVFAEGLRTPTGILPGDGGVYVANSTEILFFADTDGDGKADKKRRILNGFGVADTHHLIHTFRWGPEGRLYFNQAIYTYSNVETPSGIRRLDGGGVWQLEPKTQDLAIYARGLINPWGLQFDRWGQSFLTDGAGGEGINYAFPGATFVTAPGAERIIGGLNPGQPKHSGLEVISGRHLPIDWLGSVVTNDFRANRINRFKLEEQGSGYASRQMEDLLWTNHVAFRPVDISVGPDGAIYVADWYNPIIQHGEVDFYDPRRDQEHGRIWRITAKGRPLVKKPKLSQATTPELLATLKLPENWTRSQARQLLKNRDKKEVVPALEKWVTDLDKSAPDYEHNLLEALWVCQSLDVVNESLFTQLFNAKTPQARSASVRALQLWHDKVPNVPALLTKAVADPHPQVRLEAVIALRLTPTAEAARTALGVLEQPMDEFLDFALWQTTRSLEPQWTRRVAAEPDFFGTPLKTVYALKSVANPGAVAQLATMYQKDLVPEAYQSDVLASLARYGSSADLKVIFDKILSNTSGSAKQRVARLAALEEAARQRNAQPSGDLNRIAGFIEDKDPALAMAAVRLAGYWQLSGQTERLIALVKKGDPVSQKNAMIALTRLDKARAENELIALSDPGNSDDLRLLAATQLVTLNAEEAARLGAKLLQTLPEDTDASAFFNAFMGNGVAQKALAEALGTKKISAASASAARLIVQQRIPANRQGAEARQLIAALEASGGQLPVERMPQQPNDVEIGRIGEMVKASADPANGELLYRQSSCATCHALGGAGGRIGPDLSSLGTSSPIETIIRSVLYPTASIKEGYELQRVVKKDGSELLGYIASSGSAELILRDVTGTEVSVPKSQVASTEKVPGSLMPAGLTASLSPEKFSDLVGFLSKLGEAGDYRVPTTRFVRRWEALVSPEMTKKVKEAGPGYFANSGIKATFLPAYSLVSGGLPLAELPVLELDGKKKYQIVRFDLEVLTPGTVNLALNSTVGVTAWADQKSIPLAEAAGSIELPKGMHQITLAIDRDKFKEKTIQVSLPDGASAQTRLKIGR